MIVEFVGAPGTGKSTLAVAAREILHDYGLKAMLMREAGLQCFQRSFLGWLIYSVAPLRWQERLSHGILRRLLFLYKLKFAAKNRKLTRQLLGVLVRRQLSGQDKRKVLHFFFRDAGYYQFLHRRMRPNEALIFTEGLVHRATSLYASPFEEPDAAEILNYVHLLPQSELVIWIQAPLDVCVKRVILRGADIRYVGEQLTPFVTNSAKAIEVAMQGIREMGWRTVQLSNNNMLNDCVAELRTLLSQKFGGSLYSKSGVPEGYERKGEVDVRAGQ
jgi:thymidylate kinase